MNRRDFNKLMLAAAGGVLAGTQTAEAQSRDDLLAAGGSGKGHDCKGKNDCKGKGGCKSGDAGCKGKNSCKGKGGCKGYGTCKGK